MRYRKNETRAADEKVCVARLTRRQRKMPYGDFLREPNAATFLLMNPLAHTTFSNADRCFLTIYKVLTTTLLVHVRLYAFVILHIGMFRA